jgi:hypothetical protein
MKNRAIKLVATAFATAALSMSAAHAGGSPWIGENVPYDAAAEPAKPVFEANFPASEATDVALLRDLPVDDFSEMGSPAMPDFGDEEPAVMVASADALQTP